jgi:hydrogenase maturation protease
VEHKVLIACIGNIFLGDDAFGVEVARGLAKRELPDGVRVVDFGIRSYDLAYALLEEWELVILVDAVPRGAEPGTVYVIEPELPEAGALPPALDAHSMDPIAVLQMVRMLGGDVKRMILIGCEPSREDAEEAAMELSAPVRAAIPEAIRTIEQWVAKFMAEATANAVQIREGVI